MLSCLDVIEASVSSVSWFLFDTLWTGIRGHLAFLSDQFSMSDPLLLFTFSSNSFERGIFIPYHESVDSVIPANVFLDFAILSLV